MKKQHSPAGGLKHIFKIALRSSLTSLRQTTLILLIIAVPLAVGSTILTIEESGKPTPAERVELELGGAQAKFSPQRSVSLKQATDDSLQTLYQRPDSVEVLGASPQSGKTEQPSLRDPRDLDLVDGEWVTSLESSITLRTATGLGSMLLVEGEVWRLEETFELVSGRMPRGENEVLLSPAALERVGVELGDEIRIETQSSKVVVGVLDSLTAVNTASIVFSLPAAVTGILPEDNLAETQFYLLGDYRVSWDKVLEFNRYGIGVLSAEVLLSPPVKEQLPAELVALLLPADQDLIFATILVFSTFFVLAVPIAVLSGAAFAFGARRQERTLAIMSSLGASPKQLRQVTTFAAILLGVLGGALGIAIGLGAAALILPIQSAGSRQLYPGFHVPFFELGLLLLLSTLTAFLVSLIPARNAARVDVVSTLRGKRLGMPVSRRSKVGSLVLILIGLSLLTPSLLRTSPALSAGPESGASGLLAWISIQSYFLGIVFLIVGLMIGSAWLLELLRALTSRGNIAARYAARDILFNRKRYQAVIAAVLAASFMGSSILVFVYGMLQSEEQKYQAKLPENQILFDPLPSMPELINPLGNLGQERAFYEAAVQRTNDRLGQKLNVLLGAAEVENYALINMFRPLATIGYGTDPTSFVAELGAEGMQPLLRVRTESLCPWNPAHPDYDEYLAIQEGGNWEQAFELSRNPEYDGCDQSNWIRDRLFVGDASDLEAMIGERPSAEAVATLEAGGAIVFKEDFLLEGEVILDWYPSSSLGYLSQSAVDYLDQDAALTELPKLSQSISLPATYVPTPYRDATIMISPQTANKLKIQPLFQLLIANFAGELSVQQRDFITAEIGGYLIEDGFLPNPREVGWIIVLIAAGFVLAASSIALSLVQIESRPDLSTLSAVGAPRVFRAKVVAFQALFLTALGAVFGSIVGVLLGGNLLDLLLIEDAELPLLQLSFLTIATPILVSLLTYLFTPKAIPFRTRSALD